MKALPILGSFVMLARVLLALIALINLIGLVWFAGSFSWPLAISGVLMVVGSMIIALVPQSLLRERTNIVLYSTLLCLTAVAIMLFVYNDLFGSVTTAQRAAERLFHILLLALVGGSMLWKSTRRAQ